MSSVGTNGFGAETHRCIILVFSLGLLTITKIQNNVCLDLLIGLLYSMTEMTALVILVTQCVEFVLTSVIF